MNPLASILINNYNHEKYIAQCVESALKQTYRPIDVIVYDDGSTDNSANILQAFGKDITLIAARENHGKTSNFNQMNAINKAFEVSKGDFIFLLDGDDLFVDSKVERVVDIFKKKPNCCLIQHNLGEIDAAGNFMNKTQPDRFCIRPLAHGMSYKDYILKYHNQMVFAATSGLCFRRHFLEKILPLKEDNYDMIWPDVRLTRNAIFYGEVYHLDTILGYYRNHRQSWRNTQRQEQRVIEQMYAYFNSLPQAQGRHEISYETYKIKKWTSWFYFKRRLKMLLQTLPPFWVRPQNNPD